jgi:3-hydroxyacyl-CoA dehydrogenase / enoyl-CoA hydratase / 3-hydroxybutyryl-CoA epimerase
MKTIRFDLQDGIATITFDEEGSPVNTMCEAWRHDLEEVTQRVVREQADLRGILLASAKSTFFAGADLKATMRLQPADAARVFQEIEQTKKCLRTLETLGKPVVSLLNGSALGGGWELALVGHHRIAIDDARIQFGLPEVTLGLIPGASGITKMTRLLGLVEAQPYILEGKLFTPAEGLQRGLVHELVADAAGLRAAALAWIARAAAGEAQARHPWDDKQYRMPGGTPASPKIAGLLAVAPAALKQKTRGRYPAPEAALAAMVEGALVDFDTALRIESRYLAQLITGPVAKNMINTFFFDLNAIKSGRSRPKGTERSVPARVGILGAGMMGGGIAYVQASRGIATVLRDVTLEKAEHGRDYSRQLTDKLVAKGRLAPAAQQQLLARITPTDSLEPLRGCDLVIEAVFENRELKARVTQEAEPLLAEGGFFASNTSTLPITGLAKASRAPQRFVGIHFFSPVDKMKLVEIIRGRETDDATIARAFDYAQAIGKIPIVVNDARGFFTSRVFGTFVMEGAAMVGEGIPAAVVERAGILAGMPVGPLAVLDETALSLSVHVLDQTRADFRAEGGTYIATPGELLVERMVKEFDRNGRAAGGGFYEYPETPGARKYLWPQLKTLFEQPGATWDLRELQDRLLYRQAVETARCLAERVLTTVHDANVGSIFGIGFPAWTGGALQFIYGMGIDAFARRAAELTERHGPGFALTGKVMDALRSHQPSW